MDPGGVFLSCSVSGTLLCHRAAYRRALHNDVTNVTSRLMRHGL